MTTTKPKTIDPVCAILSGCVTTGGVFLLDETMANRIKMKGRKFGRFSVVEEAERSESGAIRWICLCDCGETRVVVGSALRAGKSSSCGCKRKDDHRNGGRKDLRNKKFGMLTAIAPIGKYRDEVLWACKCECGNTTKTTTKRLMSGHTKSCGCLVHRKGKDHPSFVHGVDQQGYRRVTMENIEGETKRQYEHIFVAEKIVCRLLLDDEVVHHIDGDRLNNAPENLKVMTNSEHLHLHSLIERYNNKSSTDCGEHACIHPMTNPDPTPTCPHCGDGMVKADSWTCYCGWGSR